MKEKDKIEKNKAERRRLRNLDRMVRNGRPRYMKRSTFRRLKKAAEAREAAARARKRIQRHQRHGSEASVPRRYFVLRGL